VNSWVWKKTSKELVLGMSFQRHVNMAQLKKRFAKIEICFHEVCLSIFAKLHHIALKLWEGKARNGIRLVLKLEFNQ
jgi:hypothetical protein